MSIYWETTWDVCTQLSLSKQENTWDYSSSTKHHQGQSRRHDSSNMSNTTGGRMSTNRQEVNGTTVRADMGAQLLVPKDSVVLEIPWFHGLFCLRQMTWWSFFGTWGISQSKSQTLQVCSWLICSYLRVFVPRPWRLLNWSAVAVFDADLAIHHVGVPWALECDARAAETGKASCRHRWRREWCIEATPGGGGRPSDDSSNSSHDCVNLDALS